MRAMIQTKTLRRIVMATKGFTNRAGSSRPAHEYIKLEFSKESSSVTAVAVDGYRLSVEHASCCDVDEDFTAYIKPILPPARRDTFAVVTVLEGKCLIEADGIVSGFSQPEGTDFDYRKVVDDNRKSAPSFRIGFNGDYLLAALQAAKESNGASFKQPVVLEFRGPVDPVFLMTNGEQDVKMVLPVRIRG